MLIRGRVENGVIVVDSGATLPQGLEVTVIAELVATDSQLERPKTGNSVLDIPTFSFGEILRPLSSDDDLLGEMLEGRF